MSMIEHPMEEHCDRVVHGALMIHFDTIHKDDAPYIEELVAHTTTCSEKVLPIVIDDDPPFEKPSDPPKPILKPLPCELKYAFLKSNETCLVVISSSLQEQQEGKLLYVLRKQRKASGWTIFDLEKISPFASTQHTHMKDDPREVYLLNTIKEEVEKHMSYGEAAPSNSIMRSPPSLIPIEHDWFGHLGLSLP